LPIQPDRHDIETVIRMFTVSPLGTNLGDRRDAAQLSELGEGQFYRLHGRRADATLTWHYR